MNQIDLLFRLNQTFPNPLPYRVAFALAIFAMLRISNLVPSSDRHFDPNKQLIRQDITLHARGADVNIRWAKNLQRTDQHHIVRVPLISSHPYMCPARALKLALARGLPLPHTPLIWDTTGPMTERKLRERLSKINRVMNLQDQGLTFHALRHEISLAFTIISIWERCTLRCNQDPWGMGIRCDMVICQKCG